MRNHDTPESLVILASASDLLLRATDGMLVDGEACTLPQLEVIIFQIWIIGIMFYFLSHIREQIVKLYNSVPMFSTSHGSTAIGSDC